MKTSTRLIWIVVAIVIGVGLLLGWMWLSRTGWGMFGYGPGMMDGNFGFGMMNGFGGVFMILLWVVIIGLGVWLVNGFVSRTNSQPPSSLLSAESPLDILKRRYARGEITKEQFEEMRRTLDA